MLTPEDKLDWCTNCYFYILLSAEAETKLFIKAETPVTANFLNGKVNYDLFLQAGQDNCWGYLIQSATADVRILVQDLHGISDVFFSPRYKSFKAESAL